MTRMSATLTRLGIAATVLVALAAGCGSKAATKVGKTPVRPVVLHAAGLDAVAAAYFSRRVAELSHGALRVEVVDAWDNLKSDREQHLVSLVADGTADLGWVSTLAFDTLGVTSFQALTAPMLIESYPLERAVLASDIPAKMLPGLASLKVTGLALFGDSLRKPGAVKAPLLRPADWGGLKVAVGRSRVISDAISGLGAMPITVGYNELPAFLRSGKVQATTMNIARYASDGIDVYAPYVTQNVNLYPGVIALIANPHRLAQLSPNQRTWIDEAAKEASARSTELVERAQPPLLASLCKSGARFATASPAQLAAFRQAFAPVVERLERDPATRAFVTQILRLNRSTPGVAGYVVPPACRVRTGATP